MIGWEGLYVICHNLTVTLTVPTLISTSHLIVFFPLSKEIIGVLLNANSCSITRTENNWYASVTWMSVFLVYMKHVFHSSGNCTEEVKLKFVEEFPNNEAPHCKFGGHCLRIRQGNSAGKMQE
jgi:hypothetical protein